MKLGIHVPTVRDSLLVALCIALIGLFSLNFYNPSFGLLGNVMSGDIVATEDCPVPAHQISYFGSPLAPSPGGFNVSGAHAVGYSDSDIATFLAGQNNFNVTLARADGHSDNEIINYLTSPSHQVAAIAAAPFLCGITFSYRSMLILLVIFVAGCWFWEVRRKRTKPI